MEKEDLINRILKATVASVEMEEEKLTDSCGKYSVEDFFNYWDGNLNKKDVKALESHCHDCNLCRSGLAKVKDIMEEADKIGDPGDVNILLQAAQSRMEQSEADMRWAAKGKPSGYNGEANGIAVSEKGDKAVIIKCHAYIDKEISKTGQIEICGIPVLKTPDGTETRSPLDSLEEKLKGPIRSIPIFREFNIHKRYINIDIGECHFTEAWSLSLAIVMSLVNALYKREDDPLTIYSANIISNGELEPVDKIVRKLSAAKEQGARRFILSSKNRNSVPQELLNDPDFKVLFFDNLVQIIDFLKLPLLLPTGKRGKASASARDKNRPKQKTKDTPKNIINGGYDMYTPRPIDTSHVKIPKYLEKLTELLSENSHDIWAQQRMKEGWTFGPQRDDTQKKNPDLIPYDELLPSEQDYDRVTVIGVIKTIIALGYRIEKK